MSAASSSHLDHSRNSTAAFIRFRPTESHLRIAGLSLLDRQLVALYRGGCSSITIVAQESVQIPERARAIGIPIRMAPTLTVSEGRCLVVDGSVFLETHDVIALRQGASNLLDDQGHWLDAKSIENRSEFQSTDIQPSHPKRPRSQNTTRAREMRSQEAATRLEKELLSSTLSQGDGIVDRVFNRPLSRQLTQRLWNKGTSPNLVSIVSIAIGLISAFFLSTSRLELGILGALLFQLSAIIDCTDGDLARLQFKESQLGKWLDLVGDQVVHIAVFVGIGLGLLSEDRSLAISLLTGSAVLGAVLAFASVLWAHRRTHKNARLDQFIQRTANRDFSVIVLVLACLDRLIVFAWLVGIGIHVYWICIVFLGLRPHPPASSTPSQCAT